jgi:hypothetical protein
MYNDSNIVNVTHYPIKRFDHYKYIENKHNSGTKTQKVA